MPCDTAQLNELNMTGLNLDTLAKSLEKDGWDNVKVDYKDKAVYADGLSYEQSSGRLTFRNNMVPRELSWYRDNGGTEAVEREIKRSYISQMIKERCEKMGWSWAFDKTTGKGKLKKKIGSAQNATGSQFGSDAKDGGEFTGFKWGKH